MAPRVLLAEDDRQIALGIVRALGRDDFDVDWVPDGRAAADSLARQGYDVAVLDIGLPGIDGIEVLRRLRGRGGRLPVLLLTARDGVSDRVLGLDAGADDYLVKPFEVVELVARLRALLRRAGHGPRPVLVGRLSHAAGEPWIRVDGEPLELSPREAAVLAVLMQRSGTVVSKSQVLKHLASDDMSALDLNDAAVEVLVHRIRKKLAGAGAEIRTVRGFGYMITDAYA